MNSSVAHQTCKPYACKVDVHLQNITNIYKPFLWAVIVNPTVFRIGQHVWSQLSPRATKVCAEIRRQILVDVSHAQKHMSVSTFDRGSILFLALPNLIHVLKS